MQGRKETIGIIFTLAVSVTSIASEDGFKDIYLVGDSLSDQGNLLQATEYINGIGFGIPDVNHYWEGRFSNDEIWVDVLADRMNIEVAPSLFRGNAFNINCIDDGTNCGTNFAYGGARTDYHVLDADDTKPVPVSYLYQGGVVPEENAFPWSLNAQVDAFASRNITNTDGLYVVLSGANDLADLISMLAACNSVLPEYQIFCYNRGEPGEAISAVLAGVNNAIATFVDAGATDILVPNIPNLGVVPAITMRGQDFIALATAISSQYNQALAEMLNDWQSEVNIIPYDAFALLTDVVSSPDLYGFKNVTYPCYDGYVEPGSGTQECADPDSYVFWDMLHPTSAFNEFLAVDMIYTIAMDMMNDLIARVEGASLREGQKQRLITYLSEAESVLTDDNPQNDKSAVDVIEEFKEYVNRIEGKQIMQSKADVLSERAEKLK
jgi:phospholipase/lecithinase/hemolysin